MHRVTPPVSMPRSPLTLAMLPLLAFSLMVGCDASSDDGVLMLDTDAGATSDGFVVDGDGGPNGDGGALADAADDSDAGSPADAGSPDGDVTGEPAMAAEPKAYSGGECPELMAGRNEFESAGLTRTVDLFVPRDPTGARVLFMWHPLGSNAGQIATFLGARVASQQRELIIVVPESRRTQSEWGYAGNDAAPDLALFDDLLSCLDDQYGIDRQQVFTTGFSAGALWSTYLVTHRADYLAAAVILSGGIVPFFEAYVTPAYALPVLVAWGGPTDTFQNIVNFEDAAHTFTEKLLDDGHFVVNCEHTGGHTPPPGVAEWGYDFIDRHSVRDGTSPYADEGLPAAYPDFCAIAE